MSITIKVQETVKADRRNKSFALIYFIISIAKKFAFVQKNNRQEGYVTPVREKRKILLRDLKNVYFCTSNLARRTSQEAETKAACEGIALFLKINI